jgi:transposase
LKKYLVELTQAERLELESLIRRGRQSVRKVKRALVLLAVDDGDKDEVVAEKVRVSAGTVARIRQRFVEEGLEAALSERPRPGKAPLLGGAQQAHLLALACSPVPTGHAKWTVRLLADRLVELDLVEAVSHQTIWRVLKKGTSNPGSASSGALPR